MEEQPVASTNGTPTQPVPSTTADRSPSGGSTEALSARLKMMLSPQRKSGPAAEHGLEPLLKLRQAALTFPETPSIFKRPRIDDYEVDKKLESSVPDWNQVKKGRHSYGSRRDLRESLSLLKSGEALHRQAVQKVSKVSKTKGPSSGRMYTSKYRGVHQTFPTKRWEAQFRRNGKPTSLGCFDEEEEAARAYDKMMIWCELNNASTIKAGITNFDMSEYEKEIPVLSSISQDELVQALRSDGRRQAAKRILRQKRDGQILQLTSGYITP